MQSGAHWPVRQFLERIETSRRCLGRGAWRSVSRQGAIKSPLQPWLVLGLMGEMPMLTVI